MLRCAIPLTVVSALFLVIPRPAPGDEPAPAPAAEAKKDDQVPPAPPVFLDERARGPLAAAQIVAAGNGLISAAYLHTGTQRGLWLARPARDPRVDKDLLAGIEQRHSIKDAGKHEAAAYNYLILHAHDVSPTELAKIARTDVFRDNLYDSPGRYVGEPIRVTGRLLKLTRMDAPDSLLNDGIKSLYQAWVVPTGLTKENSYCIVVTELPKNVKMGEKVDYEVTCDAYFFKLNRFQTEEKDRTGRVRRDLPLLIGRSFVVTAVGKGSAPPADTGWSISAVTSVLPACVSVVIVLIGFIVGLNWWFKRGDRAVHHRIAEARGSTFALPQENGITELPVDEPKTGRFRTGE